jgi:transcriptional regulator with XRE-family HTH domain
MNQTTTIIERIKILRTTLKLSQKEFGKPIPLSQGYISEVERGEKTLSNIALELLCLRHNANLDWLLTGKGEMFMTREISKKEEGEMDTNKYADMVIELQKKEIMELHQRIEKLEAELNGNPLPPRIQKGSR